MSKISTFINTHNLVGSVVKKANLDYIFFICHTCKKESIALTIASILDSTYYHTEAHGVTPVLLLLLVSFVTFAVSSFFLLFCIVY